VDTLFDPLKRSRW